MVRNEKWARVKINRCYAMDTKYTNNIQILLLSNKFSISFYYFPVTSYIKQNYLYSKNMESLNFCRKLGFKFKAHANCPKSHHHDCFVLCNFRL